MTRAFAEVLRNREHSAIPAEDWPYVDTYIESRWPITDPGYEEQISLEETAENTPKKHNVALVIGRFQPAHPGHIYVVRQALVAARTVIVGIGSANAMNADGSNPFSTNIREYLMRRRLDRANVMQSVIDIVRLNDYLNDALWLHETIRKTGHVDVIVGNNKWVNGTFAKFGYRTMRVPKLSRERFEGRTIRKTMANDPEFRYRHVMQSHQPLSPNGKI